MEIVNSKDLTAEQKDAEAIKSEKKIGSKSDNGCTVPAPAKTEKDESRRIASFEAGRVSAMYEVFLNSLGLDAETSRHDQVITDMDPVEFGVRWYQMVLSSEERRMMGGSLRCS